MQMASYKQVILARADLKLPSGKLAAQVGHAAVECALKSDPKKVKAWVNQGMPKIVLKVKDEKEMMDYFQFCKDAGLTVSLITDAGHTVVEPGTRTCVGIGPDEEEKIDKITSQLKMY